jgi:hypothetical protein
MAVTFNYFRDEAQPVEARDRILSRFLPILAPLGRLMGYTAIYPNPTRDQLR